MSTQERYELDPGKRHRTNGVDATTFVDDESRVVLFAPRQYHTSSGSTGVTSWILDMGGQYGGSVTLHLSELAVMRRIRDTLDVALTDIDGGAPATASLEWGVGDPDDCHDDDTVREIDGPHGMGITDPHYGRVLLCRDVARGPWRRASAEEVAS